MNLRILLLPIAAVAALAVVAAPDAQAAPLGHGVSAQTGIAFGPRIRIGARVSFPLGRRHVRHSGGYYRDVVSYTGGYHENRTRRVQVPGRQIGFDFEGRPLYAGNRTEIETYQIWIPRRRIVQRVWVPVRHHHRVRSRGYVTVGGRIR